MRTILIPVCFVWDHEWYRNKQKRIPTGWSMIRCGKAFKDHPKKRTSNAVLDGITSATYMLHLDSRCSSSFCHVLILSASKFSPAKFSRIDWTQGGKPDSTGIFSSRRLPLSWARLKIDFLKIPALHNKTLQESIWQP